MSYHTYYNLTWSVVSGNATVNQCNHEYAKNAKFCPECGQKIRLIEVNQRISNYIAIHQRDFWGIESDGTGSGADGSWDDYDTCMLSMSREFPTVLFTLCGKGEENSDIWNEYYLNGKRQVEIAQIIIGEFDKNKLE